MPELKEKTNWGTILAVGAGIVGAGVGVYFWIRSKGTRVPPGGTVKVTVTFKYLGDGGDYVILIRFGRWHRFLYNPTGFVPFTTVGQYTLDINLPKADDYKFTVKCTLPDVAPAGTYDAECSILSPDMEPGKDWLIRVGAQDVVKIG